MPNEDKITKQEHHGTQQEVVCVKATEMVSLHALGIGADAKLDQTDGIWEKQ